MRAWRPLLRRARRLAWRAPARTAVTASLVALPVTALALLGGSVWGQHLRDAAGASGSPPWDARYDLYTAELAAGAPQLIEQVDGVVASQPAGSSVAVIEQYSGVELAASGPGSTVGVEQGPWGSPVLEGRIALVEGRLPGPGEVVVSPWLAANHGIDVGDTLRLEDPAGRLDVVGIGQGERWNDLSLVTGAGELVATGSASATPGPTLDSAQVLVEVPAGSVAPAVELPGYGADPGPDGSTPAEQASLEPASPSPPSATSAPVGQLWVWTIAAGLFVGVGAGAAFGIGAARRRRAMGLLAANGADAGMLRRAAAGEALVVALPAALVGVVVAAAVPHVWVGLRLPGWDAVWDVRLPWIWAVLLVVVACAAAAGGAVLFSRSVRTVSSAELLDQRTVAVEPGRPWWQAPWLMVAAVVVALLVLAAIWSRGLGAAQAHGRAPVVLAVVGAWVVMGAVVVLGVRRLLRRGVIGRLVSRDLARRPLGAVAAGTVVAIWVFGALAAAANTRVLQFGGWDVTSEYYVDLGSAVPSVPTTIVEPGSASTAAAGGVLLLPVQPPRVVLRSTPVEGAQALPADLQGELAAAGLSTVTAKWGRFTGPCSICPSGWVPSIAVLDSLEGSGLPTATQDLLRQGFAVTSFPVVETAGSPTGVVEVGGVPVAQGDQPLPVDAVVLDGAVPAGLTLSEPVAVLAGSWAGLSDAQVASVVELVDDAGVELFSSDPRVDTVRNDRLQEQAAAEVSGYRVPLLSLGVSFLVLLVVTLSATGTHRREHREATRVLHVLGGSPSSAGRLAALTSGTIAATGVLLGTAAAVVGVTVALGGSPRLSLAEVVWSAPVLGVVVVVLALPPAVIAAAFLLPPPRAEVSPAALAPA
jgi:putative ABC transport system permease protein